ncbi:cell division protein ZapA [Pendulispora brunnea]|uniref:Cell division protein ZapA n=1 Tax=Pendulispora brunnea TaxID=2905690 RepID=A0ABZ2K5L3_9BACT
MDRRASQVMHVQVAGQRYKVVSSSSQAELTRLAAAVDAKLAELAPRGPQQGTPPSIVLAAIALAHDLEQERAKRQRVEVKIRDLLRRILVRIDSALESTAEGEGSRSE